MRVRQSEGVYSISYTKRRTWSCSHIQCSDGIRNPLRQKLLMYILINQSTFRWGRSGREGTGSVGCGIISAVSKNAHAVPRPAVSTHAIRGTSWIIRKRSQLFRRWLIPHSKCCSGWTKRHTQRAPWKFTHYYNYYIFFSVIFNRYTSCVCYWWTSSFFFCLRMMQLQNKKLLSINAIKRKNRSQDSVAIVLDKNTT